MNIYYYIKNNFSFIMKLQLAADFNACETNRSSFLYAVLHVVSCVLSNSEQQLTV